jgi:DNA polymerase (family 10)
MHDSYDTPMSLNEDISRLFKRFATLLEIQGANVFKVIAFQKVARRLEDESIDLAAACREGTLDQIEGIGGSSRKIIEEFIRTGKSTDFDEVAAGVPEGLIPMLAIGGLGPKTIALLWKERGITSIDQLQKAIDAGELAGLKGMGAKKIEQIKQGIAFRAQAGQRHGLGEVLPLAEAMLQQVRSLAHVERAELAGSLRRRRETIGDVDIVCALRERRQKTEDRRQNSEGGDVAAAFVKFPQVQRVLGQGSTKASVVVEGGVQVDLRLVPPDNFGAALLYFTGSKEHNVRLRGRAQGRRMTLNEWGLYRLGEYDKADKKTGEAPALAPVASEQELQIYRALDLPYIEPELREDRGEIDAAEQGKLPALIQRKDLRGDLHTHTTASDGHASIEAMAEAAIALGYDYLAITDHSKSQVIAHGLSASDLLKHVKQIRKAAEQYQKQITLLAGAEVDILADGKLDYEDAILAELDIVIASPHAALSQTQDKATARLLRAIENKYVTVIGHPTGRLIGRRAGLPLDFPKIFAAAAQAGVALEINAGWPRLDLNDLRARAAVEAGAKLAIDTDAHSTQGLKEIDLGIDMARRGWVRAKEVINCWPLEKLKAFIARRRAR